MNALAKPDRVTLIDLEYTTWVGARERNWSGPGEKREVVEIGLLVLAGDEFEEIAAFGCIVKPHFNPQLSDYFHGLTGITQQAVDVAVDLPVVGNHIAALLAGYAADGPGAIWSYGEDDEIWQENYALHNLPSPLPVSSFRNIRPQLTEALGLPALGIDSHALPGALGLATQTNAHRAVDDCRAVASALRLARMRIPGFFQ